jgi:uncharacterized protein (UPF0332 family)
MSDQENIIKLRLAKAKATFAEVDLLMQNQLYNTALSRLYYACFYATTALLLSKGLTSKTHSGTAALLHQYFVRQEGFDTRKSAFFTRLMQQREKDDYSDYLIVDKSLVEKYIQPAKEYIGYITSLLTPP